GVRVIALTGNAPGSGGWQPDTIRINLGERVQLRITATDVVHGFAVPALGIDVNEILPGHVAEVEFTPDKVGRFAFACTRWCSVDHWRMRGTIEVVDPNNPDALLVKPATPPLYQQMKIDIDAMHMAENVPAQLPSASRGVALAPELPAEVKDASYLRTHSPSEVWARLRGETTLKAHSDGDLWDGVAWLWQQASGTEAIARGQKLFQRDCAACHGEGGHGDGPAGKNLPGLSEMHPGMKRGPADFTDPSRMLGASDVLLQGKILRGGMGSGMPEWGSLYPETQMWDVIAYLRTFALDAK
ncbi:MAG: c-type cytochrome, partial [Anaerolineae bacterium]